METDTITRGATVAEDGVLHLDGMAPGEWEVVLRPLTPKPLRRGGWAKGKVVMHDDFDDPIPGMEPYM